MKVLSRQLRFAIPIAVVAVCAFSAMSHKRPEAPPWRAIGAIQPQLSSNGEHIVCVYQGGIWRLPRAGGVMRRLTSGATLASQPTWSPDGKRIAFYAGDVVTVIDADTGASLPVPASKSTSQLASRSSSSSDPGVNAVRGEGTLRFSSDGRHLLGLFVSAAASPRTESPELAWLDLDTGRAQAVPVTPAAWIGQFTLSPDGRTIVYFSNRDVDGEQGGNNGPHTDIWMMPAAGGTARKVGEFPTRIYNAAWHSGKLIVTTDFGGVHYDLWEIPLDNPSTLARKLTFGRADEDWPSVAGGWLLYADDHAGATALVTRELESGEEQTLTITALDFGRPTGTVRLNFVDQASGAGFAARVALQEQNGTWVAPPGSLYHYVSPSGSANPSLEFISPGVSEFTLPAGLYQLRAHHGPDYRATDLTLTVAVGKTTAATVKLARWTDPAARGLYSGESHIHANYGEGEWYMTPEALKPLIEAEDLNVANFMVANGAGDGVFDREFFRGSPDPVSSDRHILYWNEEFRATLWGHMTLLNLKKLVEPIFTGFVGTTNPWDIPTNAEIADHTHWQGGHVNYTHPAFDLKDLYLAAYSAKALPVDVALGKIDSLDIQNGEGEYRPSVALWYRLLNCGFHLPASAGTDAFVNRVSGGGLPGSTRAYVKIEGAFSYGEWIRGLKAGRSFVTNGLQLEFDSGREIRLQHPDHVILTARASAPVRLDRLELVYNGTSIATGKIAADGLSGMLDQAVWLDQSGWLSVRAFAGELQAHASPIYVDITGRPAGSRADAEYFLGWIDRLQAQLKARDRIPVAAASSPVDGDLRARVAAQLDAARAVYRAIASRSR